MDSKPDFIGIGAQKAATNWLWHNLNRNPDIWLPPIKELHFFDRSPQYPSPSYLSSEKIAARLFGRREFDKVFRKTFTRPLISALIKRDWATFRWRFRHYTGRYDAQWYLSLYKEGEGKLRGEITPSYSILDAADVRGIKRLLPHVKIIFILRNPVERAWSHVRFDLMKQRPNGIDDLQTVKNFIDSPKQRLRGNYLRTIDIWSRYFPAKQFFIGFYDDVIDNPVKMLTDVHKFLGVRFRPDAGTGVINEKIFISGKKRIPGEISAYLTEMYLPDLERLSERFDGHARVWLGEAHKTLGRSRTA